MLWEWLARVVSAKAMPEFATSTTMPALLQGHSSLRRLASTVSMAVQSRSPLRRPSALPAQPEGSRSTLVARLRVDLLPLHTQLCLPSIWRMLAACQALQTHQHRLVAVLTQQAVNSAGPAGAHPSTARHRPARCMLAACQAVQLCMLFMRCRGCCPAQISALVACGSGVVLAMGTAPCCPHTVVFLPCKRAPVWGCASWNYIEVGLIVQAAMHHPRRCLAGCTSGTSPSQETMLLQHHFLRQSLGMQQGPRLEVHPLPAQQCLLPFQQQVQLAKWTLKLGQGAARELPAPVQAKLWLKVKLCLRVARGASRQPQAPSQAWLRPAQGSQQQFLVQTLPMPVLAMRLGSRRLLVCLLPPQCRLPLSSRPVL